MSYTYKFYTFQSHKYFSVYIYKRSISRNTLQQEVWFSKCPIGTFESDCLYKCSEHCLNESRVIEQAEGVTLAAILDTLGELCETGFMNVDKMNIKDIWYAG